MGCGWQWGVIMTGWWSHIIVNERWWLRVCSARAQLALLLVFVLFCPTSTSTLVIIRICMRTPAQCGSFTRQCQWPLVSASAPVSGEKIFNNSSKICCASYCGSLSGSGLRRCGPRETVPQYWSFSSGRSISAGHVISCGSAGHVSRSHVAWRDACSGVPTLLHSVPCSHVPWLRLVFRDPPPRPALHCYNMFTSWRLCSYCSRTCLHIKTFSVL